MNFDAVEPTPALDRVVPDGALPGLLIGNQQWSREQRQRVRDEPGSGLEQTASSIQCRLENLLLERFVTDDL